MQNDYNRIIQERADHVFEVMAIRVSTEELMLGANLVLACFLHDVVEEHSDEGLTAMRLPGC